MLDKLEELYPLRFFPIYKEKLWGGDALSRKLNRQVPSDKIGESWELSCLPEGESVVSNGILKGNSLQDLLDQYSQDFLGNACVKKYGNKFPLLIKFIDATKWLSFQVHPDDDQARERGYSFGKTEQWYVMDASEDAELALGFKEGINRMEFEKKLRHDRIKEIIHTQHVKKGDAYFIESGLAHAIGEGVLVLEIQQSSDVTYRVHDWGRKNSQGNCRDLHIQEFLEVIDFSKKAKQINVFSDVVTSFQNEHFGTNFINLTHVYTTVVKDVFRIYICLEGEVDLRTNRGAEFLLKGDVILVPAIVSEVKLYSDQAKVVEVFV